MSFDLSISELVLLIFASLVSIYLIFFGYLLSLLWHYNGRLGPQPTKYTILPPELQAKLREAAAEEATKADTDHSISQALSTVSLASGAHPNAPEGGETQLRHQYRKQRLQQYADSMAGSVIINDEDIDGIANEAVKWEIREDRRISKLPVFEQDDCGDGFNFPSVPSINPSTYERPASSSSTSSSLYASSLRAPRPSNRTAPGVYTLNRDRRRALKEVPLQKWLHYDSRTSAPYSAARAHILSTQPSSIHILPSGESACHTLLSLVINHLTTTYPETFTLTSDRSGNTLIKNHDSRQEYHTSPPYNGIHPLEICARLCTEDFNILLRSPFSNALCLVASATCAPVGWNMPLRIGHSVAQLHTPISPWEDEHSGPVGQYLHTFSTSRRTDNVCWERHNMYIQINPLLPNTPSYNHFANGTPLDRLLFLQDAEDLFQGGVGDLNAECVWVRRERQMVRKLPGSECLVLAVRTTFQRLVDLTEYERGRVLDEIKGWNEEVAEFKGRDLWWGVVRGLCEG